MKYIFILVFSFLSITNLFATEWTQVEIPGARCGDGKPYSILINKNDADKLIVEFMGGGVCWDYDSCFKNGLLPWMHNYPVLKSYSIYTSYKSTMNPFKEHSQIYFPYCTADVHTGDHVSIYNKKTVYHYGKRNVELAFEYIKANHLIDFPSVNDLVVYGASAGAIGALLNSLLVESYVGSEVKKTMIIDAPGLHFGKDFWKKFDDDMQFDFKQSFNNIGIDVDFNDGVVAKKMGPVFEKYGDWNIGILFAESDASMSEKYGNITKEEHKKTVLSSDGLPVIAKPYSNVKIWLNDSEIHTFLIREKTAALLSIVGDTAFDFAKSIYKP